MKKITIIAEAGDNHNGNFELALQLVDKAAEAGADYVKFQTFITKDIITKSAIKADYQKAATGASETQFEMVKKLELPFDDFRKIKEYCDKKDIKFLSTPFDLKSIEFLQSIDIPFWKIPSGEITNVPYLIKIARTGKKVLMSTGMCEMDEIAHAIEILKNNGAGDITLLHCNTEYPTPMEDVNLLAMNVLEKRFNVPVGYSDHTLGIEIPIAAVALGAKVIEKHFTLDKTMEGPDHQASLSPKELCAMVKAIRNIETALGKEEKTVTPSEQKNINIARKSIVARKFIKKGEIFTEDNLAVKRPGIGISPMRWFEVIGKVSNRYYEEDELIEI